MAVKTNKTIPISIGKYSIVEKIGQGGMGEVFKATDPDTGQFVAIKKLSREGAVRPVLLKRFEREFWAAHSLDHPHIVRGLDFGTDADTPYLVMEFVAGESLGDRLEREDRLDEDQAVAIIGQIASALHLAHEHKLVHRDVKPDNILLTPAGEAKLTDLGLVKNDDDAGLTRTAGFLGTPNFMAPEQFGDARDVDARSDVYALGATVYMAVTGELPFRTRSAKNLMSILKKKEENDLTPPRKLVPALSERVDLAIRRATRAARDERHPTCLAFYTALTGKKSFPSVFRNPTVGTPARAAMSDGTIPAVLERRAIVRYPAVLQTSCQPLVRLRESEWPARTVNVSVTGLCLVMHRRFEKGTHLIVEILGRHDRMTRQLLARVMRVRRQGSGEWAIGCKLSRQLADAELHELL
jgi:serine/threonine protein kinase